MSEFIVTYKGRTVRGNKTYGPETREADVAATIDQVVDQLIEHLDEYVREIKVLEILDGGMCFDATPRAKAALKESAFDQELPNVLEHQIVHPHGFCYACYTVEGKCAGCTYDQARDTYKESLND